MKVTSEIKSDTVVLRVEGRMTLSERVETLHATIEGLSAKGYKKFILDLGAVRYIDSAGLGAVFTELMRLDRDTSNVVLIHVDKAILDLLRVTKMDKVVPIAGSEAEGLQLLNQYAGKSLIRDWVSEKSTSA